MANIFNSVKGMHPKRNSFSAHTYRNDFTAPLGVNIPCYQQHVVPGSLVRCSASALVRLQALIAPVMDNIDFYCHFWQIPYRLIEFDEFTKFISGEIEQSDYIGIFATPYIFAYYFVDENDPTNTEYSALFGNGGLLDFLGYDANLFPTYDHDAVGDSADKLTGGNKTTEFNWRPLIAYFMLHAFWYENENVPYLDQTMQDWVDNFKDKKGEEGIRTLAILCYEMIENFGLSLAPHGWEKDYFTSALPNVQYGSPVSISLGGSAPVSVTLGSGTPFELSSTEFYSQEPPSPYDLLSGNVSTDGFNHLELPYGNNEDGIQGVKQINSIYSEISNDVSINGSADLSEASAITINELRFANALQVFKERLMRFGRRRLEHYKGFFNVTPEDLRLQVPKYLGGGRIPINIADIEQTSQTSGTAALGQLAGKATAVAGGFAGFTTWCSEETLLLGICFAMPHITYANATNKMLLKTNDIYDYFNPSFEHLGEQEILNIEVYAGATQPNKEFGYTPRYTEYRFHSNEMHGAFKDSLSYWSLGRIFSSQPALNRQFIYMQPSAFDRIFAVSGQPNMVVSMLFRQRIVQPVSKYGTPMLLA